MNHLKLLAIAAIIASSASCAATNKLVPRESFTLVMSKTVVGVCQGAACERVDFAAAGSGFVIENKKEGSFVLTAGHVCKPYGTELVSSQISIVSYSGKVHTAQLLGILGDQDICLVFVPGVNFPKVAMSSDPPKLGDKAYSLAAPVGIFNAGMVLKLEGTYCGTKFHTSVMSMVGPHTFPELDAYTIPAAGGSSGAGVFNDKGELIGMTILARPEFETFSLSVQYSTLKSFVRAVIKAAESN